MVLQARGGRRMIDDDPDETRRALDAIEHAGGQALAEMRRLLGLLRDDAESSLSPPLRGAARRRQRLSAEGRARGAARGGDPRRRER
jgi:hypothetical protein